LFDDRIDALPRFGKNVKNLSGRANSFGIYGIPLLVEVLFQRFYGVLKFGCADWVL